MALFVHVIVPVIGVGQYSTDALRLQATFAPLADTVVGFRQVQYHRRACG
jgi:hypothetical protein